MRNRPINPKTLKTGLSISYAATLSSGKQLTGSQKKVVEDAVLAYQRGDHVVAWKAPGLTPAVQKGRCEEMQIDYQKLITALPTHQNDEPGSAPTH